jgi:hypothetical protein
VGYCLSPAYCHSSLQECLRNNIFFYPFVERSYMLNKILYCFYISPKGFYPFKFYLFNVYSLREKIGTFIFSMSLSQWLASDYCFPSFWICILLLHVVINHLGISFLISLCLFFFFFLWWQWGFNSGLCSCWAGTLPLELLHLPTLFILEPQFLAHLYAKILLTLLHFGKFFHIFFKWILKTFKLS